MRRWWILAVALAQVLVLAGMAGQREWVLRTGRTVWLRTTPIDPTDPMRGAYVRLGYELSQVPRVKCRDGLEEWMARWEQQNRIEDWRGMQRLRAEVRDRVVYAVLREGPHGLVELVELTDREPVDGLYLRGRVNHGDGRELAVRYGVEALFLQQGKAKALESEVSERRRKDGQLLDAEVAIGAHGLAVLKGSRWEPLGLTIEPEFGAALSETAKEWRRRLRPVLALKVQLKNCGEQPLAVWLPAEAGSFRLVAQRGWAEERSRWVPVARVRPPPQAGEIQVLQPGETRSVRLDLTEPAWALQWRGDPENAELRTTIPELADDDDNTGFAVEYAPPGAREIAGLPQAERLWLQPVRSRRFTPTGAGD